MFQQTLYPPLFRQLLNNIDQNKIAIDPMRQVKPQQIERLITALKSNTSVTTLNVDHCQPRTLARLLREYQENPSFCYAIQTHKEQNGCDFNFIQKIVLGSLVGVTSSNHSCG